METKSFTDRYMKGYERFELIKFYIYTFLVFALGVEAGYLLFA